MKAQQLLTICTLALALSTSVSYAGPCSGDIDSAMTDLGRFLDAQAAGGPAAPESSAATLHRQPTPESVAAAERRLGDISAVQANAVAAAIARARKADDAGDLAACQRALSDARRASGR